MPSKDMNPDITHLNENSGTQATNQNVWKIQKTNHPPYQIQEIVLMIRTIMMNIQQLKDHQKKDNN